MTPSDSGRSLARAVLVLAVFALVSWLHELVLRVPAYRALYDTNPFYVPEGFRSVVEILLMVLAVVLLRRVGLPGALRELGFLHRPWPGLILAMVACLPLWLVFSLAIPLARDLDPWAVVYLAGLAPLAEEVLFRGFAFGQLRKAGWGFWPAALVPAVVFGLVHIRGGDSLGQAAGVFAITALGGLLFSFLFERWDGSLWAPWGLHALMNLSWNLFEVGESAFAGWLPTAMQLTTALVAVGLSVWRKRLPVLGEWPEGDEGGEGEGR